MNNGAMAMGTSRATLMHIGSNEVAVGRWLRAPIETPF